MFLIDDIFLGPVIWIAETIKEQVDKELFDETIIKERLMALQLQFDFNEIGEEEYKKQERNLLERLEVIRRYKKENSRKE